MDNQLSVSRSSNQQQCQLCFRATGRLPPLSFRSQPFGGCRVGRRSVKWGRDASPIFRQPNSAPCLQCSADWRDCLWSDGVAGAACLCSRRPCGAALAILAERVVLLQLPLWCGQAVSAFQRHHRHGRTHRSPEFLTAKYCGHCHQAAYAQRRTAHANSFRAPWYVKNVNVLMKGKGI